MIYDCFQFNNELDILEIRLNHHHSFVDKFVITECPWTYSGKQKRLYYNEARHQQRFKKFRHKIIHRIYNTPPNGKSNWNYEHDQRNSLRDMNFKDDDLILYIDCDEIIRNKHIITEALQLDRIVTLHMKLCWYYFNCVIKPGSAFQKDYSMEQCFGHDWRMGKICRGHHLNEFKNVYQIRQQFLWNLEGDYTIPNSGWHFSNLGTALSVYRKLMSFSHSSDLDAEYDLSPQNIQERKDQLRDPLGRNVSFIKTQLDVPQYILDNRHKYKRYILDD